jgi:hypothetical protein
VNWGNRRETDKDLSLWIDVDSKQIYTVYEASACGPMPNFNENNIGFTKFCQENLKSYESMLQKYLCPMADCLVP